MRRNGRTIVQGLLVVAGVSTLGCENPAATNKVVPQLDVTASDRLPDLGMARLSDLKVQKQGGQRLLRYSTTIVNVGTGRFEVRAQRGSTSDSLMGPIYQRIYDDTGGFRDVETPAVMIYAGDGHNHWHVRDLQLQELYRIGDGANVGRNEKRGFCFWDNVQYRLSMPGAPQSPVYDETGCGDGTSLSAGMGLSIGWGDIYPSALPDQKIDISHLADGNYRLQVTADPFGWFAEADETNNTASVDFQLSHKGTRIKILSYGPSASMARGDLIQATVVTR